MKPCKSSLADRTVAVLVALLALAAGDADDYEGRQENEHLSVVQWMRTLDCWGMGGQPLGVCPGRIAHDPMAYAVFRNTPSARLHPLGWAGRVNVHGIAYLNTVYR